MRGVLAGLAVSAGLAFAAPVEALIITADFSTLGTVYQDQDASHTETVWRIFSTDGPGRKDVTDIIKADIGEVITRWQNAVLIKDWTTKVSFKLTDFSVSDTPSRLAETRTFSTVEPGTGRPLLSMVSFDSSTTTPWFFDRTPNDDNEFTNFRIRHSVDQPGGIAQTGGKDIILARTAEAKALAEDERDNADKKYDFFTIIGHELGHALGFTDINNFLRQVINDRLVITKAVSGAENDFSIPIVLSERHISDTSDPPDRGAFDETLMTQGGQPVGFRRFISDIDKLAICQIEGCTSPKDIDEPNSAVLLLTGLLGLSFSLRGWRARSP